MRGPNGGLSVGLHIHITHASPSPLSPPLLAELAKGFCTKAYEMNRRSPDEDLFLVWPRVLAAMGEPGRAQTLLERALDVHPKSTKIMAV